MGDGVSLKSVELSSVGVTESTEWTFAELAGSEGLRAVVEVTCGDYTGGVVDLLAEIVSTLRGQRLADESQVADILRLTPARLRADRPLATALSAIRTAVVELQSVLDGVSLTETLGGEPRQAVPLYANINRCLLGQDRTPAAFGAAASRAVADGYLIVKCAPFDEVNRNTGVEVVEMARPGLERVAAVRAAVGQDVRVLVDCHSRFEVDTAPSVAEEMAKLDVGWFEEPVQPTEDPDGLTAVANDIDIPIAGGESGYGEDFFSDLVRRGAVAIVMPDVKHCGGVAEAHRAGLAATGAGGRVSLHSPTGPVSQLASAHVTAAISGALALEHAVFEASWRADLLVPPERIEGGHIQFPGGAGLGASLNRDVIGRHGRSYRP